MPTQDLSGYLLMKNSARSMKNQTNYPGNKGSKFKMNQMEFAKSKLMSWTTLSLFFFIFWKSLRKIGTSFNDICDILIENFNQMNWFGSLKTFTFDMSFSNFHFICHVKEPRIPINKPRLISNQLRCRLVSMQVIQKNVVDFFVGIVSPSNFT